MTDITEKIAALEAAAEAATPGPWIAAGPSFGAALPKFLNEVVVDRPDHEDDGYTVAQSISGLAEDGSADMDYIGQANPATIRELIAHIRALESEVARREALDHESKRAIDKHNQQLAAENAALREANAALRAQIKRAEAEIERLLGLQCLAG